MDGVAYFDREKLEMCLLPAGFIFMLLNTVEYFMICIS